MPATRSCPVDDCSQETISMSSSYLCATRMIHHIEKSHGQEHVPQKLAEFAARRYDVEGRDHDDNRIEEKYMQEA